MKVTLSDFSAGCNDLDGARGQIWIYAIKGINPDLNIRERILPGGSNAIFVLKAVITGHSSLKSRTRAGTIRLTCLELHKHQLSGI